MKKKLHIDGMTCNNCVKHVTEALSEDISGVTVLEVSLENKYALVEVSQEVPESKFREVIEDLGYNLTSVE